MKQRILSHFQDYLIQYNSHQYQDLLYCNNSQYILSTYNTQHYVFNPDQYFGIVIPKLTLLYITLYVFIFPICLC